MFDVCGDVVKKEYFLRIGGISNWCSHCGQLKIKLPHVLSRFSQVGLCNAMDCSPPGSFVHGSLQPRIRSALPCALPGDLPNQG